LLVSVTGLDCQSSAGLTTALWLPSYSVRSTVGRLVSLPVSGVVRDDFGSFEGPHQWPTPELCVAANTVARTTSRPTTAGAVAGHRLHRAVGLPPPTSAGWSRA
jgi:hypothetical protein